MESRQWSLAGVVVAAFVVSGAFCQSSGTVQPVSTGQPRPDATAPPPDAPLDDADARGVTAVDPVTLLADASPACGAVGQPCCDDGVCNAGGLCYFDICEPCGSVDALCCGEGAACGAWAVCDVVNFPQRCRGCGGEGQSCCGGDERPPSERCNGGPMVGCNPSGVCARCDSDASMCFGPPPCGTGSRPPCDGGACLPGHLQRGGSCVPCGGTNQVPCAGGVCARGHVRVGLRCRPCGAVSQPCCAGGACAFPLTCNDGACAPRLCGRLGQPCCGGSLCVQGRCRGGTCQR